MSRLMQMGRRRKGWVLVDLRLEVTGDRLVVPGIGHHHPEERGVAGRRLAERGPDLHPAASVLLESVCWRREGRDRGSSVRA